MNLLDKVSPFRNRVCECAVGVAESFPSDTLMQVYMSGVQAGANHIALASAMNSASGVTELALFETYKEDIAHVIGGVK